MEKIAAPGRFWTRTPPNGTPNADSESARNLQTESGLETSRGGPKHALRQNGHSFPAPRNGGAEKAKISRETGAPVPKRLEPELSSSGSGGRDRRPCFGGSGRIAGGRGRRGLQVLSKRDPRTPKTGTRGLPKCSPRDSWSLNNRRPTQETPKTHSPRQASRAFTQDTKEENLEITTTTEIDRINVASTGNSTDNTVDSPLTRKTLAPHSRRCRPPCH